MKNDYMTPEVIVVGNVGKVILGAKDTTFAEDSSPRLIPENDLDD